MYLLLVRRVYHERGPPWKYDTDSLHCLINPLGSPSALELTVGLGHKMRYLRDPSEGVLERKCAAAQCSVSLDLPRLLPSAPGSSSDEPY